MTSPALNFPPKAPPPNTTSQGFRAATQEPGGCHQRARRAPDVCDCALHAVPGARWGRWVFVLLCDYLLIALASFSLEMFIDFFGVLYILRQFIVSYMAYNGYFEYVHYFKLLLVYRLFPRMKTLLMCFGLWVNPEDTMLRDVSQPQTGDDCMIPLLRGAQSRRIHRKQEGGCQELVEGHGDCFLMGTVSIFQDKKSFCAMMPTYLMPLSCPPKMTKGRFHVLCFLPQLNFLKEKLEYPE